jgi:hypothetical protein
VNESPEGGRATGIGPLPATRRPDGTEMEASFRTQAFFARSQRRFAEPDWLSSSTFERLRSTSCVCDSGGAVPDDGGAEPASRECRMGESPARRPEGAAPGPQGARSATVLVPASERVPVAARCGAVAVPEPALRERSALRTSQRPSQALYSDRGVSR